MSELHTIVQQACVTNDLNALSKMHVSRESFMSVDAHGNIPLLIAAGSGNITVIKMLDVIGDKVMGYDSYKMFSARNKDGYNALSLAAKQGHVPAVVALYEVGAYDSFTANEFDWRVYAALRIDPVDDPQNVASRLKIDAQKRLTEIYAKALYDEVTFSHARVESLRNAIHLVGNVNANIYDEHPALYHAIRYRNITSIRVLLEEGALVKPEMLPLALDAKDEEVISLIGQHIPLSATAMEWGNLFDVFFEHAIRHNDAKVVSNLLPHLTISKMQEGLLYGAEIGSADVVKCLLDHGIDINTVERGLRARTPAMLAAKNGHADVLHILIDRGANLNQRSERGPIRGLTALDYAKIKRRKNCVKVILEALALKKYGDTPITHAAAMGTVSELISTLSAAENTGQIPELTILKNAIRVAKESKQPRAIIKELQKYMHAHYSRFRFAKIKQLLSKNKHKHI